MALAATLLYASNTNPSGTSHVTSSVTPTANALQLVGVYMFSRGLAGSVGTVTGLSGNGLTWVEVDTEVASNLGNPFIRLTVFRALGAAPSTGALTVSLSKDTPRVDVVWIEITGGVITTGANGSGAMGVTAKNLSTSTSSNQGLVTFGSAFTAATSYCAGFFLINSGDGVGNVTPGAGFTELADPYSGPGTWSFAEGMLGQPTGLQVICAIPSRGRWIGIAAEVLAAGAGGTGDGDDLFVLQVGGEQPAMIPTPVVAY